MKNVKIENKTNNTNKINKSNQGKHIKLSIIACTILLALCLGGCGKNSTTDASDNQKSDIAETLIEKIPSEDQTETSSDESVTDTSNVDKSSNEQGLSSKMQEELAAVEAKEKELCEGLQKEGITQMEMTQISCEIYQLWDDELNSIWTRLTETLDSSKMDELKQQEKEWIAYKEKETKAAGAECEGGSIQPLIENDKAAELTKDRVYELAAYLQ